MSSGSDGREAPATITVLSGDIHFAYVADVVIPGTPISQVRQVVCSPIRNILRPRERRVMRFAVSRVGRRIGGWLMRRGGRPASALTWELTTGPVFQNNLGTARFNHDESRIVIEVAVDSLDAGQRLETAISL